MTKFRTKIPVEYHQNIIDWYSSGMSAEGIKRKLLDQHSFKTNERTLYRLLAHLKAEKKEIVQAAMANQLQKQVVGDLEALDKECKRLQELAETSYNSDHNLYLRTVDRLHKILQTKLGLSDKQNRSSQEDDSAVLISLAGK